MRILHTSDWHLGQNFYSKSRAAEHQAFLDWLLETAPISPGGCDYCRG
ncbi:exonuclease SbcD [Citrobacter koseri]|uniref:Exonuclease SbcD n=1 Tax=Citrobacter koseri TaxID=545 RepID=A0A2X2V573_CITKO|nr:exonuclease SbcD [Citrobacter koseri]